MFDYLFWFVMWANMVAASTAFIAIVISLLYLFLL